MCCHNYFPSSFSSSLLILNEEEPHSTSLRVRVTAKDAHVNTAGWACRETVESPHWMAAYWSSWRKIILNLLLRNQRPQRECYRFSIFAQSVSFDCEGALRGYGNALRETPRYPEGHYSHWPWEWVSLCVKSLIIGWE